MKFMLNGMDIPENKWHLYIKDTVHTDNPNQIFKAFKKGFKIAETYWTYSSLYLSSAK